MRKRRKERYLNPPTLPKKRGKWKKSSSFFPFCPVASQGIKYDSFLSPSLTTVLHTQASEFCIKSLTVDKNSTKEKEKRKKRER